MNPLFQLELQHYEIFKKMCFGLRVVGRIGDMVTPHGYDPRQLCDTLFLSSYRCVRVCMKCATHSVRRYTTSVAPHIHTHTHTHLTATRCPFAAASKCIRKGTSDIVKRAPPAFGAECNVHKLVAGDRQKTSDFTLVVSKC